MEARLRSVEERHGLGRKGRGDGGMNSYLPTMDSSKFILVKKTSSMALAVVGDSCKMSNTVCFKAGRVCHERLPNGSVLPPALCDVDRLKEQALHCDLLVDPMSQMIGRSWQRPFTHHHHHPQLRLSAGLDWLF